MRDEQTFIDYVCEAVVSGGAICLLGAGFSIAGRDRDGNDFPVPPIL